VVRSFVALALLASTGCSRDHSLLAADAAGSGGAGGAGATEGAGLVTSAASGGGGGSGPSASSGATSGAGASGPVEPEGAPRLVVVHGLLDRPRVAVCLANAAGEGVPVAPSPAGGVAFASAADVPATAVPAGTDDVTVVAVTGDEDALASARCRDLLADPGGDEAIEVVTLGVLPRSAVEAPRVIALVAAGCLGGEDEESEVGEAACGPGFASGAPTATLVAAPLSRITASERVGLQAVGGALAAAPLDLAVRVGSDGAPLLVAEDVSLGAALPLPPNTERDAVALSAGGALEAVAVLPGDGTELATVDLAAAMDRAGIGAVEDGRTYAIVLVGPAPTLGPGPFWPSFDAAMISVTP
jgi:hypothetical protein